MNATFRTTRYNISLKIFAHASTTKSTTKLHRVAKRVQHHTTSRKTRDVVSYNICLVKKFDRNQTSYNTIQHDTTRWPNECNISYNIKVV